MNENQILIHRGTVVNRTETGEQYIALQNLMKFDMVQAVKCIRWNGEKKKRADLDKIPEIETLARADITIPENGGADMTDYVSMIAGLYPELRDIEDVLFLNNQLREFINNMVFVDCFKDSPAYYFNRTGVEGVRLNHLAVARYDFDERKGLEWIMSKDYRDKIDDLIFLLELMTVRRDHYKIKCEIAGRELRSQGILY